MSAPAIAPKVPAMADADIAKVRKLEAVLRRGEQVPIQTTHSLHAGLYARTVRIPSPPPGMLISITGALIKIPTLLTISGHATVSLGSECIEVKGYHVLEAAANRKQAFVIHSETFITMAFKTSAKTVEEAEAEFTDETDLLLSRSEQDKRGVKPCQE